MRVQRFHSILLNTTTTGADCLWICSSQFQGVAGRTIPKCEILMCTPWSIHMSGVI